MTQIGGTAGGWLNNLNSSQNVNPMVNNESIGFNTVDGIEGGMR